MRTLAIPALLALVACAGIPTPDPIADAPEGTQVVDPLDDGVAPTEAAPEEAPRRFRTAPRVLPEPFGPPEEPEREPDQVDV